MRAAPHDGRCGALLRHAARCHTALKCYKVRLVACWERLRHRDPRILGASVTHSITFAVGWSTPTLTKPGTIIFSGQMVFLSLRRR